MKDRKYLSFLFLLLFLGSCATIPKEAFVLSEELGNKINTIEKSHISLLHSFFDQKRALVDSFMLKKWVPVFAKSLFNDPLIKEFWKEIVKSDDDLDKLRFITTLGPGIVDKISQKRLELIQPLDALEKDIEYKIRNEYEIARSINNSLTSFLYNASKIEENRNRYLNMLGITDDAMNNILTKTDNIVKELVTVGENVMDKEMTVESYLEKIKQLRGNINESKK
jgi:hypothetical protein